MDRIIIEDLYEWKQRATILRAVVEDPTVQIVRIDPAQSPNRRRQSEYEDEGVFEQ
mgnify:CR=1 FL=1